MSTPCDALSRSPMAAPPAALPTASRVFAHSPAVSLSHRAAFYLQASLMLTFLAGASAPTPLYAIYQATWGFSSITTTVVFGVYALAVLLALLVVGSLSDYVGRRPVLLVATFLQTAAMALFMTAHGVGALVAARIVQGLATGAAAGAVGAGLLDLDRTKGAIANAVAPMLGTALGAVISGLMVQYLPAPTLLVYLVLGGLFIAQAVGLALMPETVTPRPGALAALRPRFRVPASARGSLLLAVPTLVAGWALAGFYGSLGPTLLRQLVGSGAQTLGGLALFLLAGSGALAVSLTHARPARRVMLAGTAALAAGVAVTLTGLSANSLTLFFIGTVIAGTGFGAAFHGALRTVLSHAGTHERAGVLSTLYLVAYLAMGLPAVLGGLRVSQVGVLTTAHEYGLIVVGLAILAPLAAVRRRRLDRRTLALVRVERPESP